MADNYKTIVVGSDGSKSSLLAVERAAKIAAAFGSTLVIGTAYYENEEEAAKTLRQDSVTILGDDKALENLESAAEHARAAGAPDVQTATRPGTPVQALMAIVNDNKADLLVVGNKGMRSMAGRIFGNIPGNVAKKAPVDVMLVDTRAEGHD